ncbi:MAG TPA: GNAT family protein [Pyrinomonadaceae bacterium]|nr:GNAT family protein [Pyrinomonadaceae bacterium]
MTSKHENVLNGTRLRLRQPRESDSAELLRLNRASSRLHRGLVSPPKTEDEFQTYMEFSRRDDCRSFLICLAADGSIVGAITLSQIFMKGFRSAYLGYYIGEQHASRGYMTEALQLILNYAFERLELHRVEANIQPGNVASIALVRRAGFTQEGYSRRYLKISGRWRDHERWALLAEDRKQVRLRRAVTIRGSVG